MCIPCVKWKLNESCAHDEQETGDGLDLSWGEMMSLATSSLCNFRTCNVRGTLGIGNYQGSAP
jgi:hypothetical protein